MNRSLSLLSFVIFVFAVGVAKPVENNEKRELTQSELSALRGLKFYQAFECCVLAEVAGDKSEQQRLANLGIEEGRKFLKELEEGKIKEEDIRKTVPMIVMFSIGGPSHDFALGRIYAAASDSIWADFKTKGKESAEERKDAAEDMLRKRNSKLLGR